MGKAMAERGQDRRGGLREPFLAHATMEPMNCTVHVRKDGCDVWVGTQVLARAQATAAAVTGLPLEKVEVHNHLIGGGFGRRLEVDIVTQAVRIAQQVDGPVKVVWTPRRRYPSRHLSALVLETACAPAWTPAAAGRLSPPGHRPSILSRWAAAGVQERHGFRRRRRRQRALRLPQHSR